MAITSPVNTLLKQIYTEKTLFKPDQMEEKKVLDNNRCLIKLRSNVAGLMTSDLFLIASRTTANAILILLLEVRAIKKLYRQIFGEYNLCLYYSSDISSKELLVKKS